MTAVRARGLGKRYGRRWAVRDCTLEIPAGRVTGLVGPNGAGKTTLLRLILGEIAPDAGTRFIARGTRLGYLPQEAAERWDGTVLSRAMQAHHTVLAWREELDALHQRLAEVREDDPQLAAMLERAGELQHHLDRHDEHALEPEARRVLGGLGFSAADQDRPLAEFSGGWRMRAALAALLLTDPTLLFLDEPTNHLDLPAMEWLEDYLESFHGGLVIVSHDRVFLDRVASEVRELDAQRLTRYATSFTGYLEEREERREQLAAQNAQLAKRIEGLERFVERFGAKNTKASQAQSKRKLIARLERQRVVLPRRPKAIRFSFPDPPHAGRVLMKVRDLRFGYGEQPDLLRDVSFELARDDKVAIVGANGAGKTTLLRLVAGQLDPRGGTREESPLARPAWFAQHAAETLDGRHTVLESLEEIAGPEWRPRLRTLLGSFLFSGDDVFKPVRVLSGGERQRVALSRILLAPANLLLLDEPTHHLDLAGKDVLEEALAQYPGAVVVVTHDRSLMARLATRVIEVANGRATLYPGGYDAWESARVARDTATAVPVAAPTPVVAPKRTKPSVAAPQRGSSRVPVASAAHSAPGETREQRAARQKRERELARVERDIETREAKVRELEALLADPDVYHDGERAKALVADYERIRAELESLWQRMSELG